MVLILNIQYGKCPEITNTVFHIHTAFHTFLTHFFFFFFFFFFAFTQLFLSGIAPVYTLIRLLRSSVIFVYTVGICHFVRNFGIRNFRTFTMRKKKQFWANLNSGEVILSDDLKSDVYCTLNTSSSKRNKIRGQ